MGSAKWPIKQECKYDNDCPQEFFCSDFYSECYPIEPENFIFKDVNVLKTEYNIPPRDDILFAMPIYRVVEEYHCPETGMWYASEDKSQCDEIEGPFLNKYQSLKYIYLTDVIENYETNTGTSDDSLISSQLIPTQVSIFKKTPLSYFEPVWVKICDICHWIKSFVYP